MIIHLKGQRSAKAESEDMPVIILNRMYCGAGWLSKHYPAVFAAATAALLVGDVEGSGGLWVKDF